MPYMDGGVAPNNSWMQQYVEYLYASSAGMFINMICEVSTYKLFYNVVVSDDMNETIIVPKDDRRIQ